MSDDLAAVLAEHENHAERCGTHRHTWSPRCQPYRLADRAQEAEAKVARVETLAHHLTARATADLILAALADQPEPEPLDTARCIAGRIDEPHLRACPSPQHQETP